MDQDDNKEVTTESDDRISLKEVKLKIQDWKYYILSKWRTIFLAGIIGAVLGLTYSLVRKPKYTAELTFALQDDKASGGMLGSAMGVASQLGIDIGGLTAGGEFSGDNLLELFTQRSMVENALLTTAPVNGKQQTLAELYISSNGLRESLAWKLESELQAVHYLPNVDRSTFTPKQDSLLDVLQDRIVDKNLTVDKKDKKLNIVHLTVTSKSEIFSRYFAQALESVVSDFYVQTKTEKSAKNVAVLKRQADSVRRELNGAIQGVAASTDINPHANLSRQVLHVPSLRRQVDVQANTIILGELVKNLELSKMTLLNETPILHVIDMPASPLEKKHLGVLLGILGGFMLGSVFMIGTLVTIKSLFILDDK